MDKTPLGITPRHLWQERRYYDLLNAVQRYVGQGIQPPTEWLAEAQQLARDLLSPRKSLVFYDDQGWPIT